MDLNLKDQNLQYYLVYLNLNLCIFGLKLATLEPELAILLSIFESELGIFELKLATLGTRTCNLTKRKFTISFCIFLSMALF